MATLRQLLHLAYALFMSGVATTLLYFVFREFFKATFAFFSQRHDADVTPSQRRRITALFTVCVLVLSAVFLGTFCFFQFVHRP